MTSQRVVFYLILNLNFKPSYIGLKQGDEFIEKNFWTPNYN